MNRAEHLQWAKHRALAHLQPEQPVATQASRDSHAWQAPNGKWHTRLPLPVTPKQLADACASFISDLGKHPDIDPTAATMVYTIEVFSGGLNTVEKVKHFINGTN